MVAYPKDWELKKIGELLTVQTGIRDLKDKVQEGKYPFYVRSNIIEKINSYDFNTEAVLTAGDGNIGEVFHYINGKFSAHQRVYVIHNFNKVQGKFFYYWFSNSFIKQAMKFTAKATVDSIRKPTITEMSLPVPSISEQQAIADTLSTFDDHIDNLTQLIEKKKAIRDGALEDLVTGKVRLDGFDGDWEISRLEKLTKQIITGGTPSTAEDKYWNGAIPWLSSTEIHQKRITSPTSYITEVGLKNSSAQIAPSSSVVVALAGQGKTRGTAAILEREMALNQSLAAMVANDDTDYTFLYYALEKSYEDLRKLSSGDGGRGGLNKKILRGFEIKTPPSKKEQQAIASILTAMDEELDNLEREKEKILQMKAGAMDDLLTGKIRLV